SCSPLAARSAGWFRTAQGNLSTPTTKIALGASADELLQDLREVAVEHRAATVLPRLPNGLAAQLPQMLRQDGHHPVRGVHARALSHVLLELGDHHEDICPRFARIVLLFRAGASRGGNEPARRRDS